MCGLACGNIEENGMTGKFVDFSEYAQNCANETSFAHHWTNEDGKQFIYDPWSSRENAINKHSHYHTTWARNIHENWLNGAFSNVSYPDVFNKTVFVVGHGTSLSRNAQVLEKIRSDAVVVWLNSAVFSNSGYPRKTDWVMCIDSRIDHKVLDTPERYGLITFPGIDPEILNANWREVCGVTFWPKAPLNDWMRELFPGLPSIQERKSVVASAMHLFALFGAAEVILMGMDFEDENGPLMFTGVNGEKVRTTSKLSEIAMSIYAMAKFINIHTDTQVINATGRGLVGMNLLNNDGTAAPFIKQVDIKIK